MELTKQERSLAERSAKKYNHFIYRNSQWIGWIGVVLFGVGLMRILPILAWYHHILSGIGFVLIFFSQITFSMIVIGKLYNRVQELENKQQ